MKIALINGSPKLKESASGCILHDLKSLLDNGSHVIYEYSLRKPQLRLEEMKDLAECDVFVFAFPLYVDSIPSHLLNCLIQLEDFLSELKERDIKVYVVVNCGFYEGYQNKLAIEIMKNWCVKSGLIWGQGIGIGAGGMITSLKNIPMGHGPKRNQGIALEQFASNILSCSSGDDLYITANLPRFLYKIAAEKNWRQSVKANGLKRRDLFLKK